MLEKRQEARVRTMARGKCGTIGRVTFGGDLVIGARQGPSIWQGGLADIGRRSFFKKGEEATEREPGFRNRRDDGESKT